MAFSHNETKLKTEDSFSSVYDDHYGAVLLNVHFTLASITSLSGL